MSRSQRKTPIFGHTTACSEAYDKRQWHKRWRLRQRHQLATLDQEDDPLPVHRRAVSSTWKMAKDGKGWFGPERQKACAELLAADQPTPNERDALVAKLLAKWRAK